MSADFCYPVLGDIKENKSFGISGHFDHEYGSSPVMEIASSNEIKDGDACILTDGIDQTIKPYSVKIKKVSDTGEKNLIVEIKMSKKYRQFEKKELPVFFTYLEYF